MTRYIKYLLLHSLEERFKKYTELSPNQWYKKHCFFLVQCLTHSLKKIVRQISNLTSSSCSLVNTNVLVGQQGSGNIFFPTDTNGRLYHFSLVLYKSHTKKSVRHKITLTMYNTMILWNFHCTTALPKWSESILWWTIFHKMQNFSTSSQRKWVSGLTRWGN